MTTTPCAIRRLELLLARTPDMECADDLRVVLADAVLSRRLLDDARAQEPCAYMFVDDLERFLESETFAQAYSIPVGAPDRGHSVPLYAAAPVPAQPAAVPEAVEFKRVVDLCWRIHAHGELGNGKGTYDAISELRGILSAGVVPEAVAKVVMRDDTCPHCKRY